MKWVMPLAGALLLSGCGISATGVIQSGEPATGVRPVALVYFVVDDRLVPVYREIADPVNVRTAVELLLTGPDPSERKRGLTTALVRVPTPEISADGARVSLQLSAGPHPLPPIAVRQLICTVAEARLAADPDAAATGVTVVVTGPDGQRTQGTSLGCSVLASPPVRTTRSPG
ncbi:hypothetical protein [Streptomyces sp. NPDC002588]|uniref:hypothetical protein n=1 Tax=Streptomyces sp. NPDC002588 TaxID=3154419 RepID=UPI0033234C4A